MKHFMTLLTVAAVGFAFWQYPAWRVSQQQLTLAEDRVEAMIAEGINHVTFSDLTELRRLPSNIRNAERLEYLNLSKTSVYNLSGIEGLTKLKQLNANQTRVMDLQPLSGLPNLRLVYLHGTWAEDLTPLTTLPALEQLDIGKMQIASLEPVTQIAGLNWLNLHRSYALDGSTKYFRKLEGRVHDLSGGNSYRQGYRPGEQYQWMVTYWRWKARLGYQSQSS